jgi:hypothetical protein
MVSDFVTEELSALLGDGSGIDRWAAVSVVYDGLLTTRIGNETFF